MNIPKHYSLHSENDSHFNIHDDRDGKTFKVAKKDIHPAHQIKIMKMQKLAEGGDVDPAADVVPVNPDRAPQSVAAPDQVDTQAAAAPPQSIAMQAPGKTPEMVNQFMANQAQEESGMRAQGAAQAKMGEMNAKTYEDTSQKLQNFLDTSNQSVEDQSKTNDAIALDIQNTKLDPNRYYHNMSTGSKIGNAIAAIVGGIGAGASHTQNLALQSINDAIARDVEFQKMELGKKNSLLSYNLDKYKNMKTAQLATMTQLNAVAQGKIEANTARYGGLANQDASQAAVAQLKNQNLKGLSDLKQSVFDQQLKQHLASGSVEKDNPLDYVQYVVPGDKQKEVATELGKAQYASQNHKDLMDLWDKAQKEQTVMRTGFGAVDAPATRELELLGDPLIHDQDGRVNEFEKNDFKRVLPSSGQSNARQKELRAGFEKFILGKRSAPLARTYGIDVDRFNATKGSPSADTKTVNGKKYTRGANGEAVEVK